MPHNDDTTNLVAEMFSTIMQATDRDEERADEVLQLLDVMDFDDAPTRARIDDMVKPWRSNADFPATEADPAMDLLIQARTGTLGDPLRARESLRDAVCRSMGGRAVLRYSLASENRSTLKRLLQEMTPEDLFSPTMIATTYRCYRYLQMNDEADLAKDRLQEEIYTMVAQSWLDPAGGGPHLTMRLAEALHAPELIPEAYAKDLSRTLKIDRYRLFFQVDAAHLRHDWDLCDRLSEEACRLYPKYYDLYRLRSLMFVVPTRSQIRGPQRAGHYFNTCMTEMKSLKQKAL